MPPRPRDGAGPVTGGAPAARPSRARRWLGVAACAALLLALLPFVVHAARLGLAGLARDLWPESRFDPPGATVSAAIFAHMVAGAAVTLLAPLQLSPRLRARWPALHRWSGRVVVAGALATAVGGLAWIAARGTIGGWQMSAGFALYGALMLVAAVQTLRFARARAFGRHQAWALRLFVLAMGSWLYRVHYTIWWIATDGAATAEDFSGAFDRVQTLAFFLPYLLALEVWLRRARARPAPV